MSGTIGLCGSDWAFQKAQTRLDGAESVPVHVRSSSAQEDSRKTGVGVMWKRSDMIGWMLTFGIGTLGQVFDSVDWDRTGSGTFCSTKIAAGAANGPNDFNFNTALGPLAGVRGAGGTAQGQILGGGGLVSAGFGPGAIYSRTLDSSSSRGSRGDDHLKVVGVTVAENDHDGRNYGNTALGPLAGMRGVGGTAQGQILGGDGPDLSGTIGLCGSDWAFQKAQTRLDGAESVPVHVRSSSAQEDSRKTGVGVMWKRSDMIGWMLTFGIGTLGQVFDSVDWDRTGSGTFCSTKIAAGAANGPNDFNFNTALGPLAGVRGAGGTAQGQILGGGGLVSAGFGPGAIYSRTLDSSSSRGSRGDDHLKVVGVTVAENDHDGRNYGNTALGPLAGMRGVGGTAQGQILGGGGLVSAGFGPGAIYSRTLDGNGQEGTGSYGCSGTIRMNTVRNNGRWTDGNHIGNSYGIG